ncbi:unnamed protein product [Meloidogyne enterolobii]|uniref:Uncharacterized protein n=1 Tax=Meloidogyne enterolobii TaxID=390850 RepID=A0ACB1AB37_MELEN
MPKVSDVWKHFNKIPLENKVECKNCGKKYAYNTEKCSTNSLLRYLRVKHHVIYNKSKNKEQQQTNQDQGKSESKDDVAKQSILDHKKKFNKDIESLSSDQDMEEIDNISLNSFDVDSSREISGL